MGLLPTTLLDRKQVASLGRRLRRKLENEYFSSRLFEITFHGHVSLHRVDRFVLVVVS